MRTKLGRWFQGRGKESERTHVAKRGVHTRVPLFSQMWVARALVEVQLNEGSELIIPFLVSQKDRKLRLIISTPFLQSSEA